MDVFNAGLGTDNILINASNITALEQTGAGNRSRIDGGGGNDLLFGSAVWALTIKSSKPSPLTSPALETDQPLQSFTDSPLITKPPAVQVMSMAMA
jgi:hypothetical protein